MKKVLIISLSIFAVLLIALTVIPSMLIDENKFAAELTQEATRITSYPASVAGVEVSVFPSPRLTIRQFSISNNPNASSDRLLLVDQMVFRLGIIDLLKGNIIVRGAEIIHPVVELESFADGTTNYSFIDNASMPGILRQDSTVMAITGGLITNTNAQKNQAYEIKDIAADVKLGGTEEDSSIDVSATLFGKPARLSSVFQLKSLEDVKNFATSGTFEYSEEGTVMKYDGNLGKTSGQLAVDGTLSVESKDIIPWFARLMASNHMKSVDALQTPLPVKLQMKTKMLDGKANIEFADMELAKSSVGKGTLAMSYGANQAYALDLHFSQFDLFEVFKDSTDRREKDSLNHLLTLMLPEHVSGTIEIKGDKARVLGADGHDFMLSASLEDGELVVNQSYVRLPGDSQAILFGILKPNEEGLIHLDGSIEFYGKDFSAFIDGLGYPNLKGVIKKTAPFRGKANLFFSDQLSTLSEFKFQAGDLFAAGGMTTQVVKGYPTVEITLKTNGLRLDPFFSLFTPITQSFNVSDQLSDASRTLPWLNQVRRTFILTLNFDDFELGSFKGSQSSMVVTIAPKKINFDSLTLSAGELGINGSIGFEQTGNMPNVDIKLDISKLSLLPFLGTNLRKLDVPRGNRQTVWSQDAIDLSYLKGFNGFININVQRAVHPAFTMDNLRFDAENHDGTLTIKNMEGALWNGAMRFSGTLEASSVYSLQGSFYLDNILVEDMLKSLADVSSARGRMNISGQVATTGMNADGWIKNAQLNAVMKGAGIVFSGFDLQGLIQAISSVRSVADVVNTSRVSMLRSETMFDRAEGSVYMDNGVLKTNEVLLATRNAVGRIGGEVDITNWISNLIFQFQLTSLSTSEYPSVVMTVQDSADNPVIGLDTRSLEAFVATRGVRGE
ncbi:MAG: AsmA family protein [Rickettsiales bacterium]